MQINLNNPSELTMENVAKLIGSVDDSQHWQIRVKKNGIAYMSDVTGNQNTDDLAFRMETLSSGNDYVGPRAANDKEWVGSVFATLKKHWPNPLDTYIDIMEDAPSFKRRKPA